MSVSNGALTACRARLAGLCVRCAPSLLSTAAAFEGLHASRLPDAQQYESSYMHREQLSHVLVTRVRCLRRHGRACAVHERRAWPH